MRYLDALSPWRIFSFCLRVALFFEQFNYFFLELALHKNFAILHAAAAAAFALKLLAKLLYVVVAANEILYYGYGFATAVVLFYAHAQLLLLLGQGANFLLFIGGILEIGVGGIYYVEPLFPVVLFHCLMWFFVGCPSFYHCEDTIILNILCIIFLCAHKITLFLLRCKLYTREKHIMPAINNIEKVPEPTLRRLPWYLSVCRLLKSRGEQYVSSTRLSKETNIVASQIAKDLSCVNIIGRTRVGYDIDNLLQVLEDFLGFTRMHKAFLFGVGRLGTALLNDSGLKQFGLEVVAAFDVNQRVVGHNISGIPVYHISELEKQMRRHNAKIGVLTVPIDSAQEVADKMVVWGVKAIWNFTPLRIRVPENIVVQNTSLYAHLSLMFNRLEGLAAVDDK